jgi:hypothetical protein
VLAARKFRHRLINGAEGWVSDEEPDFAATPCQFNTSSTTRQFLAAAKRCD